MASTIHLDIVSLEEKIFSGIVRMVVVSGVMGELGILPGHIPLLSTIEPGQIRITLEEGEQDIYYVSGGLLEVQPDLVTILADTVTRAEDLDEAAAITARENAQRQLANREASVDFAGAMIEITQAVAKLRTIKILQNYKNKN